MPAPATRSLRLRALGALLPPLALVALASCGGAEPRYAPASGLGLERVATGLDHPVHLTAPAGDPRLFIVEQPGRIRIVAGGRLLETPFLDLTDRVGYGGERGLLSVAFHPDYTRNGLLYVNYTDRAGDTRIERYSVTRDSSRADPASAKLILSVPQPYSNHNGGHILFGPDGMLYIGMGDGGSAADPKGHGQNRGTLLGALLRIDVNRGGPYAIPPGNPFAGRAGMRPEIWAWGLRNPWRMCFDRESGLLYIADVGQNDWEEVNVAPARTPGLNYGWNVMEGAHCFRSSTCDREGLTLPALEYGRREGCSITGGAVYRGRRIPAIAGHYFFSDYCRGWIRSFRYANGSAKDLREWRLPAAGPVTSFGEDGAGELYVISHDGNVWRIVPGSAKPTGR